MNFNEVVQDPRWRVDVDKKMNLMTKMTLEHL
jgi:hypothetical protein